MKHVAEVERTEESRRSEAVKVPQKEVYRYEHSGIAERHGTIPGWLLLVAIALLIWGVYYTIKYWNTG
jgi:hypothetical protein